MHSTIQRGLPVVLAAMLATPPAFAVSGDDFEFHGYFRSGIGGNSEGGDQVCFFLPNAGAKYRLGNECETYSELQFDGTLYRGENDAYFKAFSLLAFVVEGENDFEQDEPAVRQMFVEAGNLFDGALAGAKFWAGKRFYRRHDVHINDFYFWDMSGTGGGIEDLDVGFGKIAFAWFANVNDQFQNVEVTDVDGNPVTIQLAGGSVDGGRIQVEDDAMNRFDLRLYNIETNPGGTLTLGLDLRFPSESRDDFDPDNGYGINVLHFQNDVLGGFNKIIFQYGQDAAANVGNGFIIGGNDGNNDADPWTFRVVEQLLIQPTDDFSMLTDFVYERNEDWFYADGRDRKWFSFGARPKYYFNDYLNFAFEFGYDYVDIDGKHSHLYKFTPTLQLSAGRGFFARPALRLFATYATWDDTAQENGIVGGVDGVFGDDTSGWTYGVQAETWW